VGGLLVVGLGCEVIAAETIANAIAETGKPVAWFTVQALGGSVKAAVKGAELCRELLAQAARAVRTPVSIDHLVVGLECGGSDAFSGITANPALGVAADLLVDAGER